MKSISISEMKRIQVDILKDVHLFCEKNKIRYTLIFGSLLGAIRHKGYIPWDDDIDIAMPRPDYERFVSSYKSSTGYYYVYDYRKDPDYYNPYAKVADVRTILEENISMKNIGINIDVFPFDYMFDSKQECFKFIDRLNLYKKIFRIKLVKPGKKNSFAKRFFIRLAKLACFFISAKKIVEKEYALVETLKDGNAKYIGLAVDPEIDAAYKSVFSRSMFEQFAMVPFENQLFYVLENYEEWLKTMYGDYMTPPPETGRTSPHTLSKIYWIDDKYHVEE